MKTKLTAAAVVLVAFALLFVANHTVILRELCAAEIIEDSTGETVGAYLDGDLK